MAARLVTPRPSDAPDAGRMVLGIDPGLNVTGYGLLDVSGPVPRLQEAGVLRGSPRRRLDERLLELHAGVSDVLRQFRPAAMALEDLYSHYERPRTAILMGHARGVICLAAAEARVPVLSYAATNVKKLLTGSGRAPKSQVQLAVMRELQLPALPEPPDVADALAIALCHYYVARSSTVDDAIAARSPAAHSPPGSSP